MICTQWAWKAQQLGQRWNNSAKRLTSHTHHNTPRNQNECLSKTQRCSGQVPQHRT
jgi:hypothetical protein